MKRIRLMSRPKNTEFPLPATADCGCEGQYPVLDAYLDFMFYVLSKGIDFAYL